MSSVSFQLKTCDVYLIFEPYHTDSIKNITRSKRAGIGASRNHQLTMHTPLPSQKVTLTVTHNKVELINLICQYLAQHMSHASNRLVITGEHPVPTQITIDKVSEREDLRTTQEEADIIIVQQMVRIAETGVSSIKVICEDTDVFVLLILSTSITNNLWSAMYAWRVL